MPDDKVIAKIPHEVMLRCLVIAADEFAGNMSQYLRVAIFRDLFARDLLNSGEMKILFDRYNIENKPQLT